MTYMTVISLNYCNVSTLLTRYKDMYYLNTIMEIVNQ